MKFITLQTIPKKQWTDENGKTQSEFVSFPEITVPVNESLGFKPMWAIPITTFKETMASVLLTAPNYPFVCCVFETDDYVRVDKVKHYYNIKHDEKEIPLADDNTPDHLVEYCLNIESLPMLPMIMGSVPEIESLLDRGVGFDRALNINTSEGYDLDQLHEFNRVTSTYIRRIPLFDEDHFNKQMSTFHVGNKDIRSKLLFSWYKYKYTILPVVLWSICEDSMTQTLDESQYEVSLIALEACINNIHGLLKLDRAMAFWSYDDCSVEGFEQIHGQVRDLIIDSEPVLDALFFNESIGRNDKCPCNSGKKYKKCHGR